MNCIIGCAAITVIGFKGGEKMSEDDIKEKEMLDKKVDELEKAIRAWLEERENRKNK